MLLHSADIVPTASVKPRTGSPKMARNEEVCAHQKSYRYFPKYFLAVVYKRERSCAPILRFFFVASDGTTTECQIQNHIFGQFCHCGKIASPIMLGFGRCYRHLLED